MTKKKPSLTYEVQVIHGQGTTQTTASGLSDDGIVVGQAVFGDGAACAFSYRKKRVNRLAALPGATSSLATGISADGARIVGNSLTESGDPTDPDSPDPLQALSTPCLFKGTNVSALELPQFVDGVGAYVNAINADGTSVGSPQFPDAHTSLDSRGVVWDRSGAARDVNEVIGFHDGRIMGVGLINDSGDMLLFGMLGPFGTAAVYFAGTNKVVGVELYNFFAYGMNSSGQLAGQSWSPRHAFLWRPDGTARDLGTLGGPSSCAMALNDAGLIVGGSDVRAGGTHAFIFGRKMTDLNAMLVDAPAGIVLESAVGINAANQVAANGTLNGERRAFLLTPSKTERAEGGAE